MLSEPDKRIVYSQGDFHLVEQVDRADNIYLYFAPVLVPPGVYVGHRVLQEANAHSIILNCADSQWFLDGVPGFGDSIEGTAKRLRDVIDHLRTPSSKVVAFGGSMGGYGAILLGGLAGADVAVVQGAELFLNITGGASSGHLRGRQSKYDIFEVINSSKIRVQMYAGEGFLPDLICALAAIERCGIYCKATSVRAMQHTLPNYFNIKYKIIDFINKAANNEMFCLDQNDTGSILERPDLVRLCFAVDEAIALKLPSLSERIGNLKEYGKESSLTPEHRSFVYNWLARGFFAAGARSEASHYAANAVDLAPGLIWNAVTGATISEESGDIDFLSRCCALVNDLSDHLIFREDLNVTYMHSRHLWRDKGDDYGALRQLRKLLQIVPDHEAGWHLAEIITSKLATLTKSKNIDALPRS